MVDLCQLRCVQLASVLCDRPPPERARPLLNYLWGSYCIVGPRGGFRPELYEGFRAAETASGKGERIVLVRAAYAESAEDDARPRFEAFFPGKRELVDRLMWLHKRQRPQF